METPFIPEFQGNLRKHCLVVPECIRRCTGIKIFGKRIKSIVFTTDVSIIRNVNADAVIAVYPFTPQPVITQSIMLAADIPVFCGVGGGITSGKRVVNLALHAEYQGAIGVVVNAPTANETIRNVVNEIDIPVVVTVASEAEDISARIGAGAAIINVSAAAKTPALVRKIREEFPQLAIMATGGPTDESVIETIEAGANAITWTPPTNGEQIKMIMDRYRQGLAYG
ncbi:hydrolase [Hydrogenoanaerobacterium sp.]|uniref:hydrolase n=1 Tax=Hydrogenoanaerobacterium sp. TaxID=2953763 RepID=UPI00289ECFE9|nr:hydrolase [Hydrogenoanaerobacterium sp.]